MFKAVLKFLKSVIKGILDLKETTEGLTRDYYISNETMELIKKFEGYSETAYPDGVGVWTIGYGNTFYEDGTPVKQGDTITRAKAETLLKVVVEQFAEKVYYELKTDVSDCQFGALVSLTYNIGIAAFRKSTLLRKVNVDPSDPTIPNEFARWVKAGGKTLNGLVKRRKAEAEYYFNENC